MNDSGLSATGPDDTAEYVTTFSEALDRLEGAVSESDSENRLSVKNTRMWLAINQEDTKKAVELFGELSKDVATPTKPAWLLTSLLTAGRVIGQLLGRQAER